MSNEDKEEYDHLIYTAEHLRGLTLEQDLLRHKKALESGLDNENFPIDVYQKETIIEWISKIEKYPPQTNIQTVASYIRIYLYKICGLCRRIKNKLFPPEYLKQIR